MNPLKVRVGRDDDAGYSLIELLTAMSLFVVVLAVTMQGVVLMMKDTVRTQTVGDTADALRKVGDRLDKGVPYASALDQPVRVGNSWYLEFLNTTKVDGVGGATCVGYKVDTDADTISMRTWTDGAASLPGWTLLAKRITNDPSTEVPFQVFVASPTDFSRQRLVVYLEAQNARGSGSELRSTLVARNTGLAEATITNDVTQRVCNAAGVHS